MIQVLLICAFEGLLPVYSLFLLLCMSTPPLDESAGIPIGC